MRQWRSPADECGTMGVKLRRILQKEVAYSRFIGIRKGNLTLFLHLAILVSIELAVSLCVAS